MQEAFESGAFSDLPGQGKPIPGIDQPLDENWWIRQKLREEQVSLLPPLLEARHDIEQTRERITLMSSERRVREELKALQARVREALDSPRTSPPVVVLPVNVEEEFASWRTRRSELVKNSSDGR